MNKIISILPYKEEFTQLGGAVAIGINEQIKHSIYKKNMYVFGRYVSKPIRNLNFISSKSKNLIFKNSSYINEFVNLFKNKKQFKIFEIHNRPLYVKSIKDKLIDKKIIFYFHNDPLTLKGSVTLDERLNLYTNCDSIIFLSHWIKKRFFQGFNSFSNDKAQVIYPVIEKQKNINFKKKNKNVIFVGRLNKSKGYDVFIKACEIVKKQFPDWNFESIGSEPRREIQKSILVKELGQLPHDEVLKYYKSSSIAIGNSKWQEPLGRLAIEASAAGCLSITSNTGGMIETNKYGIILKLNNVENLSKILLNLLKSKEKILNLQKKVYKNYYFSHSENIKKIDKIRTSLLGLNKNININLNRPLKILHIANTNQSFNGRLYYSTSNKINNGFIYNKNNVLTISDRDYLRTARKELTFSAKNFNKIIYENVINFNPDAIILGHVDQIYSETFEKIKKFNSSIKIARWYIDSISKEFIDNNKKVILNNLNFIDKLFITSDPKKLKNDKFYFIPNPVDIAYDIHKNFNNKNLPYDLFFAVSHGQNRGVLKEGKIDERIKIIKNISKNIQNINTCFFGYEDNQPVWGSSYYHYLSLSKMALNVSRGTNQEYYSSDRISSLIGNGLLVFMEKKTKYQNLFSKDEIVFFENIDDLKNKIAYFYNNDKLRMQYAKKAYLKYHKYFNNKIVCNYILHKLGFEIKNKAFYWEKKIN